MRSRHDGNDRDSDGRRARFGDNFRNFVGRGARCKNVIDDENAPSGELVIRADSVSPLEIRQAFGPRQA